MEALKARLLDGSRLALKKPVEDLRAHALRAYPEEAVGYIATGGDYRELPNLSPRPERSGALATSAVAALMASGELRALCHSHPDGPDAPSETDMRTQMEWEVPFIIVSTNGQATAEPFAWGDQLRDDADLIGRPFRHGISDCYSCIRAWWRKERGVLLPDFPRNWEWWLDGTPGEKDLYQRFFVEAGFYPIDIAEVREGDVWLAAIRSAVPNHGGVYIGDGLCLNHVSSGLAYDPSRLSKREPMVRWTPRVTHWLRRDV